MSDTSQKGKNKHLFGSSEKSDFIVNMSVEKAQKLCGIYSIIGVLILAAISIPYYFTQHIKYSSDAESGRTIYLNEKFIFFISTAVLAVGFIGFVFFLIANMKKITDLKSRKGLIVGLGIIVVTVISCLASENIFYSIYGYIDRSEGLLAIIGYWGIFCTGMTITTSEWRIKLSDFIVGIGLFQSVVGILQVIPATAKIIPNYFNGLFLRFGTTTEKAGEFVIKDINGQGIYQDKQVASGFLCTPHALAAVATVAFMFAAIGFIFDKSRGRKIFYAVSAPVIAAAGFLTCTETAVVGISAALVLALVFGIVKSAKEGKFAPAGAALCTVIISAAVGGVLFGTKTAEFLDEKIIYTDSNVRLSVTSIPYIEYHQKAVNGETDGSVYSLFQQDAFNTIQDNPLLGVGPDNWPALQQRDCYTDKCYNEFLDLAQTRGIICAGLYVIFLLITVVRGLKAIAGNIDKPEEWVACAALAASLAYIAQSFLNISSVTSSPFLWLSMGLVWSYNLPKKKKQTEE